MLRHVSWLMWIPLFIACAPASGPARLPADWVAPAAESATAPSEPSPEAEEEVSRLLDAQAAALPTDSPSGWHLAALLTDLGVSAKGAIGALGLKGSPAVSVIWRKKPQASPDPAAADKADEPATLAFDGDAAAPESLDRQVELGVRAVLASTPGVPEAPLRESLRAQARLFADWVSALAHVDRGPWKLTRFRLDLSVEASGQVAPIVTAGADTRLRFEWYRATRPKGISTPAPASAAARSLAELAGALSDELAALADGDGAPDGFLAYGFRVGVGVTAGGTFDVVKGSATAIGHLTFARDVRKPPARPAPLLTLSAAARDPRREAVRDGLKRAFRMSRFFTRVASHAKSGAWGVHEVRASFDLSLTGKLAVATVGGVATTEINFYNERF